MIVQQKEASLRIAETGFVFELKNPVTTVGRSDENDIVLELPEISRKHAAFWKEDDVWYIQDLNTPNGIEVNSFRLAPGERYPLGQRSHIVLASVCALEFEAADDTPDFGQTQVLSENLLTPRGRTSELESVESGETTLLSENMYVSQAEKTSVAKGKKKSKAPLLIGIVAVLAAVAYGAFYVTDGFKSSTVRELQKEIQAIGEVTLASEAQIQRAKEHFDLLSAADKVRVSNAEQLEQAEASYETLVFQQRAAQFDDKVNGLGEITLQSEAALIALREDYDALDEQTRGFVSTTSALKAAEQTLRHLKDHEEAARIDRMILGLGEIQLESEQGLRQAREAYDAAEPAVVELVQNLSILEQAEKDWLVIKEENDYTEIKSLLAARDNEQLTGKAAAFLENFPSSAHGSEVSDICVTAYLQLSKQYEYGRHYEAAEKTLLEGQSLSLEADNGRIQAALDALQRAIASIRPYNGVVLGGNRRGGYCQLVVHSGSNDVLVKLADTEDPENLYLLIYVRGGESATVNIMDGDYTLKYVSGETWYGMDELFGEKGSYHKADTVVTFKTSYEGNYVHYDQQEVTLYQVFGGNMSTSAIDSEDF